MSRRLSRVKAKIRDSGIRFARPDPDELAGRLDAVLGAIYAAYGSGWDDWAGADPRRRGLAAEAIELGRLLASLLPGEAEALGLLSLMLYCEARRDARRDAVGAYVPLAEQDRALWSQPMIAEAERLLATASGAGRIGRFQLEAAIQSAHASGAGAETIAYLYEGLVRQAPTIGALVGRAAALAELRGAAAGWALLEAIPGETVGTYQPYWALAAHLLARLGRREAARAAYGRAIGLSADPATRAFLLARAERLMP